LTAFFKRACSLNWFEQIQNLNDPITLAILLHFTVESASIKSMSSKDLHWNSLKYGPDSEQLRRKLSEIKMAYNFIAVSENQVTRMTGYAPYTTYITDQGWAGIVQFFDKRYLLSTLSWKRRSRLKDLLKRGT